MKLIWIEFKFGDGQYSHLFVLKKQKTKSDWRIFDILFTTVRIVFNLNLIMLINIQDQFYTPFYKLLTKITKIKLISYSLSYPKLLTKITMKFILYFPLKWIFLFSYSIILSLK